MTDWTEADHTGAEAEAPPPRKRKRLFASCPARRRKSPPFAGITRRVEETDTMPA